MFTDELADPFGSRGTELGRGRMRTMKERQRKTTKNTTLLPHFHKP